MRKSLLCFILLFLITAMLISPGLKAQDSHFSQFAVSPVVLNPAMTGTQEKGEIRVVSQLRNQWTSVANQLSTTTLAVDMPFKQRWGLGGYIINYNAANSFNVLNMVLSGSYDITSQHQKKHKLNMGLQLGFTYKSTSNDKLVFDNQYVDGTFNTDLPSGENTGRLSKLMPEVTYGLFYENIEHKKKFKPHAGAAIFHLTNPNESFLKGQTSRLPLRYVFSAGSKIQASDVLIFDPKFLFMRQKNAMELNVGFDGEYITQPNIVSVLWGFYYRYQDALIPVVGLDYKSIIFKMSYDINISSLNQYSKGKGGIEFSLVFLGGKHHHATKEK